jgi:RNA polymerase sigma-70 factor (ECF subfamily)
MSTWPELDGAALPESMLELAATAERVGEPMTLAQRVEVCFEQFRDPVFRYLMRLCGDPLQAEELTQEVFLRLYRHLQRGQKASNPAAWLFTVAHNLAIDLSRSRQNVIDLDEAAWDELAQLRPTSQPTPEQLVLQRERMDRVHLCILRLTPLQRECLHLRIEGLRYREIAKLLNVSIATVAEAVRRGLVNLAAQITPEVQP